MLACYKRTNVGGDLTRYQFQEKASLFGRNNGFIPWLLERKIPKGQGEPYAWHIDVVAELSEIPDHLNSTLVIDLKPTQNKDNLYLFEVLDIWGHSQGSWTPMLFRLGELYFDEDPTQINRNDFILQKNNDGFVYEFLYASGSVEDGKVDGKWNPPSPSPTNAVILWPETLSYFIKCIHAHTPCVFGHQIIHKDTV